MTRLFSPKRESKSTASLRAERTVVSSESLRRSEKEGFVPAIRRTV